jgi:DNA-binding response OmpR family regulator
MLYCSYYNVCLRKGRKVVVEQVNNSKEKQEMVDNTHDDNNKASVFKYTYKDLVVDNNLRKVFVHGIPVKLTKINYEILLVLIQNQNKCITRDELFTSIWQYSFPLHRG